MNPILLQNLGLIVAALATAIVLGQIIIPNIFSAYGTFLLRQFFRGIPDELEESAYIDGSGTMRTFYRIILPLSIPMLITVFLFAFCWQWTDDFYTNLFFVTTDTNMLVKLVGTIPPSLRMDYAGQDLYYSAIRNTCGLMIIFPLVILYAFCQRFLVQGIEQSGLAN